MSGRTVSEDAVWQDAEFGAYTADLPLWEELAGGGGAVLELGPGAGRVALHLARRGARVVGVEADRKLSDELARRAEDAGLAVSAVSASASALPEAWPESSPPGSAIAPLHVIQQLDPSERGAVLSAFADLLAAGGRLGATVVDEGSLGVGGSGDAEARLPDMREVAGWVYSSEPLWVQLGPREIKVRRLRERVSPEGEIERSVHDELLHRLPAEQLEAEAAEAGLEPVGRRAIASGPNEADSIAVVLEARA